MTNFFLDSWQGKQKLWKVFWVQNLAIGWAILWLIGAVESFVGVGVYLAFNLLIIAYAIFIFTAMWKCSPNSEKKIWGQLVRVLVVISVISLVFTLGQVLVEVANET